MLINMYYLFHHQKEGVFLKEKQGVPINVINANRFVFNNILHAYQSGDDET